MSLPAGHTETRPRKRIGRYLVTGRIGRGGMGMVYRGLDETLEREVAIKTLTAEGTLDEESRQRFEIEAKAAAKLQHPNILTVFELGEERGVPFIAMELLPGADLETLLRSGETLLLREKLEIVIQVCRGLHYAHEHRIVHRDIKPSNIRILDDGTAKIMDFGIAKLQGTGVTKAGMMVGTVHYMSPEQIRGRPLDGRSDVFSLGVILYELLSGRRPFPGGTATDVLYRIVHEPPAPLPLPEHLGLAGPRLQRTVDRALAKNPDERLATAAELEDALAEVAASLRPGAADAIPPQALEAIATSRRLVKEGRLEEGVRRLRQVVELHPESLEARRALRVATRELARRERPSEPEADGFPELDATFQASPTRKTPETATVLQPTEVRAAEPTPTRRSGPWLLAGAAAAVLVALAGGLLLLRGGASPSATALRIHVRSQPPGAEVLLDGQATGIVTDGELVVPASRRGPAVLTFRKAGQRDVSQTVMLRGKEEIVSVALSPAAPAAAVVAVVTEPPGAAVAVDAQRVAGTTPLEIQVDPSAEHRVTVTLEGHTPQELRLAPGKVPAQLRVALEPAGPLGAVSVTSSYPLDVIFKGRMLAKGQVSPRVSLPQGRQLLTLQSSAVFLRANVSLDVRAESSLAAPELGRVNIRAIPDNCEVFIDGISAGYLPILDRPVAVGGHAVVFKWPDGVRQEEPVEVAAGRPAYVMGRKE